MAGGFVVAFTTVTYLAIAGYVERALAGLTDLGVTGHVIMVLLFVLTGLPFLSGYTVLLLVAGYMYGWAGSLATCQIGTLLGALVGFWSTRRCGRGAMQRRVDALRGHRKELVRAFLESLAGRYRVVFWMGLRLTPITAFGWINGLAGALTDISLAEHLIMTAVSVQPDVLVKTFAGASLRGLVDLTTSNQTLTEASATHPANVTQFIVQLVLSGVLVLGSACWGHMIMRAVFKRARAQSAAAAAVEQVQAGEEAQAGGGNPLDGYTPSSATHA
jgi:uncharacterized membrane protein YdjX (TVP38/TMEM64 family)